MLMNECQKIKHYTKKFLRKVLFIGCPIGFYGNNCTSPCRYPSFGTGCQGFCPCSKEFCDNISGCRINQGQYVYFVWYSLEILSLLA